MERLTTNKDVSEMSMIELAHNSCYAKEHKVRYRDYDTDIDARELTIKLLDEFVNIPNEFTCDEDFDEFIADAMQYGIHNILGLIAIFYRNLWAMADLRERLKEYEDLSLTPDKLREIDKMYTNKCKQISDMSRHIVEKLEDAKPPYNRILDSLEENRMQVGQISGLNKAIKIVRECMENMDKVEYRDVCEPEYLGENIGIGCRNGMCRCGTVVMSYENFCSNCGVKLEWGGVHG